MSEQPPTYPSGMPAPAQAGSGLAIAALVLGIVSLVLFCIPYVAVPGAIVAIILGAVARGKAKRGEAAGKGMATAGLVCGIISILFVILLVGGVLAFMGFAAKEGIDLNKMMQDELQKQQRMNQSAPAEPAEEVAPQSWLDTPTSDRAA